MARVITVGELLVDFVPAGDGSYRPAAGGAPANVAAAVARLGGRAAFIGRVGQDSFGRWLVSELAGTGVDVRYVVTDPGAPTALAFVTLEPDGERDFSFYRGDYAADTRLSPADIPDSVPGENDILHFCSNSLTHDSPREATAAAAGAAARVSFDVNLRLPLWQSAPEAKERILGAIPLADILKLSRDEADFLGLDAAGLLALGPSLVLLTMGAQGVQVTSGQDSFTVPAWPARTMDTTGAGDCFIGAFLEQAVRTPELSGEALRQAVSRAQAAAALSTESPGAIPSYPSAAELAGFMSR